MNNRLIAMEAGPQVEQKVRESANNSSLGSSRARKIIEEVALAYAGNLEEAKELGEVIGQAISMDREDRGMDWMTRERPRWDAARGKRPNSPGQREGQGARCARPREMGSGPLAAETSSTNNRNGSRKRLTRS